MTRTAETIELGQVPWGPRGRASAANALNESLGLKRAAFRWVLCQSVDQQGDDAGDNETKNHKGNSVATRPFFAIPLRKYRLKLFRVHTQSVHGNQPNARGSTRAGIGSGYRHSYVRNVFGTFRTPLGGA